MVDGARRRSAGGTVISAVLTHAWGTHGPARTQVQRFPLVARFRPPCLPLPARVRGLVELADTAVKKSDQGLASAVYNQAALIASDLGLPDLAREMFHQHAAYLHACPLSGMSAIRGLEPVVNLARLQIRVGGNGGAHGGAQPFTGGLVLPGAAGLLLLGAGGSPGLRVIRLHDARHGTATLLTAAGVAPRVVMEILGHSQISITMDVYTHVVQDTQREAMSHMDRLLRRRSGRQ